MVSTKYIFDFIIAGNQGINNSIVFFYRLGCAQIASRAKDPSLVPWFTPDTSHPAGNLIWFLRYLTLHYNSPPVTCSRAGQTAAPPKAICICPNSYSRSRHFLCLTSHSIHLSQYFSITVALSSTKNMASCVARLPQSAQNFGLTPDRMNGLTGFNTFFVLSSHN
jgi:hypothetical protein